MKQFLIPLFIVLALPKTVNSSHLNNQKELIITSESTKETIMFAKYLKDKGVVKYTPHGAFELPSQSDNDPPRESIEARIFLVFKNQ